MKVLRRRGSEVLFNAEAVRGTNSIFSEVARSSLIGWISSLVGQGKKRGEYEACVGMCEREVQAREGEVVR